MIAPFPAGPRTSRHVSTRSLWLVSIQALEIDHLYHFSGFHNYVNKMVFFFSFWLNLSLYDKLISSFQFSCSVVSNSATPWTTARQASLSITNSRSLLKLVSIKSVMSSNHLILCRPLLLPSSIFPSIRVFSSESALHIRWPTCWSFSFSINPSNEYSVLISLRLNWLEKLIWLINICQKSQWSHQQRILRNLRNPH